VEFLVDDTTGEYFFLEVNTRLQVEHPVTEESRGIDLVREQLRVAMGEPVRTTEAATAHAIEVRLYAEDPATDFLPATGRLHALRLPDDDGVRWDLAVEQGNEVTIDFDPMIGKVIASGPDRPEAARRLATALEQLHLGGVVTNRDFLVAVLRDEAFLAGDTTTDYIGRVAPRTTIDLGDDGLTTAVEVAALWMQGRNRAGDGRWGALPAGFRNGRLPPATVTFSHGDRVRTVAYRNVRDGSVVIGHGDGELDGEAVEGIELATTARVLDWSDGHIEAQVGRVRRRHAVTALAADVGPAGDLDRLWVQMPAGTVELAVRPRFVIPGSTAAGGGFAAPMPGKVLEVRVAAGDAVSQGQTLVVLEAMKMEHRMDAPEDGVVDAVHVTAGQQVAKDEVLLTMATEEGDG
jgi:propionyl-CoA carboxylase alpha chain